MTAAPLFFRLVLSLAYWCVGIFMFIYHPFQVGYMDWTFGVACLAYGSYRGYRAIKDYQRDKAEEE